MPKVLIMSYYFPPSPTAGAERIRGWAENLSQFGWEPIIVTRHWDTGIRTVHDQVKPSSVQSVETELTGTHKIVRVPFTPSKRDRMLMDQRKSNVLLRKWRTFSGIFRQFLSPKSDSRYLIYRETEKLLSTEEGIAAIIASGEPYVLMKYAHDLSGRYNIPWIADYRDAWTNNHSRNYAWPIRLFYRTLEKKYNSSAAAVLSVSSPYLERILDGRKSKKFVLENSHSPLNCVETTKWPKFTITYGGTIYDDSYVDILIAALTKLFEDKRTQINMRFVGIDLYENRGVAKVKELAGKYPDSVSIIPRCGKSEYEDELCKAQVLLGLIPGSQSEGVIAAKTYQYLGTSSPIIMLESYKSSKPAPFDSVDYVHTRDEFVDTVIRYFTKWDQGASIAIDRSSEQIEFSHATRARRLSEILNNVATQ